jgi:hypothetical protein
MAVSIQVDLDISEILSSIWRKSDKLELLKGLLDDLDSKDVIQTIRNHKAYENRSNQVRAALTGDDHSFTIACNKINANRWRINLEDEQYILNLADKL